MKQEVRDRTGFKPEWLRSWLVSCTLSPGCTNGDFFYPLTLSLGFRFLGGKARGLKTLIFVGLGCCWRSTPLKCYSLSDGYSGVSLKCLPKIFRTPFFAENGICSQFSFTSVSVLRNYILYSKFVFPRQWDHWLDYVQSQLFFKWMKCYTCVFLLLQSIWTYLIVLFYYEET